MNTGLIIKSTGSWYNVLFEGNIIFCRIKGKLRLTDVKTTNPLTVGDYVDFSVQEDGSGLITSVHERKNYIIRKSTRFHKEAHMLASNIDLAVLMLSLKNPQTPYEFVDRFLVTAEAYHIKTIILINKIDLLDNEISKIDECISIYDSAGYECIPISVQTKYNISKALSILEGKTCLVAGNSGVGKTSFINALNPSLNLKTGEISDYHKSGKHITTHSEIFYLNNKTYIIDTPGIKAFGLIDFNKNEIGLFFPEIFKNSKNCKYYNCTHLHEPGCEIIQLVENGTISSSRYNNYMKIMTDPDLKHR